MTTTVLNTKTGEVENKIPVTSDLVTITILNINIGEVENKIRSVTATVLRAKIGEIKNKVSDHAKYINTPEFSKFAGSIFDAKSNQANLPKNSNLNTAEQHANKNKDKIEKLQTFDLSYFLT